MMSLCNAKIQRLLAAVILWSLLPLAAYVLAPGLFLSRNNSGILQQIGRTMNRDSPAEFSGPSYLAGKNWNEELVPVQRPEWDSEISVVQAEILLFRLVEELDVICKKTVRLGNAKDGGWNVCVAGPYKPVYNNSLVYSFGINNDFSFDDAFALKYGATVRAFDPSMNASEHVRTPGGATETPQWAPPPGRVHFYPVGLGGKNRVKVNRAGAMKPRRSARGERWTLKTISALMKELGDDQKVVDYLKFDIEYSEWEVLETIYDQDVLHRVKQIGFEVHTIEIFHLPAYVQRAELYRKYCWHLQRLHRAGFRKWSTHRNPFGVFMSHDTGVERACCYELVYINTRFLPDKTQPS